MQKHICGIAVASLLLVAASASAGALPNTDYDTFVDHVELRPGVEVDIHVKVFVNEAVPCLDRTLFAVHGYAHTAATWEPLAEALFEGNPTGPVVCRLAAIDLPGRGGSTLPTNLAYGDLVLDDHVTAILATLDGLGQQGVRPHTVLAHSQGGLLTQLAQQRLVDQGSDLRSRFQIRDAILLASVGPAQIPFLFVDSGVAGALIAQFLTYDPALGLVIAIPDFAFPTLFFTDLLGVLASGAPTPAQVTARGYNAPEPLLATLNLVGATPFTRPSVAAGIFSQPGGTRLSLATYEQDVLIRPSENTLLYEHLTGDASLSGLAVITGPETVHDLHVSDPAGLLAAVAGTIRF